MHCGKTTSWKMYIVRGHQLLECSGNVRTRTYIFQVDFTISQTHLVPVQWMLWPECSVPERSQNQLVCPLGNSYERAKPEPGSLNVLHILKTVQPRAFGQNFLELWLYFFPHHPRKNKESTLHISQWSYTDRNTNQSRKGDRILSFARKEALMTHPTCVIIYLSHPCTPSCLCPNPYGLSHDHGRPGENRG